MLCVTLCGIIKICESLFDSTLLVYVMALGICGPQDAPKQNADPFEHTKAWRDFSKHRKTPSVIIWENSRYHD